MMVKNKAGKIGMARDAILDRAAGEKPHWHLSKAVDEVNK